MGQLKLGYLPLESVNFGKFQGVLMITQTIFSQLCSNVGSPHRNTGQF